MPEQLKKLREGQRLEGIPASTWNAFVDATKWSQGQQASWNVGPKRNVPQTGLVRLKNTSGYDRERFDVLGIDDVFPDPVDNLIEFKAGPVLHGITPTLADHRSKFAILWEPAEPDMIVTACVAGVSVARLVQETSDTPTDYAEMRDGDAGALGCGAGGSARVLWREDGIGTKWGVVRLGNGAGYFQWYFNLLETLPSVVDDPNECPTIVRVVRRAAWDPTECDNVGMWEVRKDDSDEYYDEDIFYAADYGLIGFCGTVGTPGIAEWNPAHPPRYLQRAGDPSPKPVLTITNLQCPADTNPSCPSGYYT